MIFRTRFVEMVWRIWSTLSIKQISWSAANKSWNKNNCRVNAILMIDLIAIKWKIKSDHNNDISIAW